MPLSTVVLGGGITGLATCFYLTRLPRHLVKKIVLVEKRPRLGGLIRSDKLPSGVVVEWGPHSIRCGGVAGRNTLQLIEQLGLTSHIVPVSRAARSRRLILSEGKLCPLPASIKELFARKPPFSQPLLLPVLRDVLLREKQLAPDITVYDLFKKRFNNELADFVADPLCRGVCAGDSRKISAKALFPSMYTAVADYGSLIRGQIALERADVALISSELATRSVQEKWSLISFTNGIQQLVDGMIEAIHKDGRTVIFENEPKVSLKLSHENPNRFDVTYAEGHTVAEHLFSCISAKSLSKLIGRVEPELANKLLQISAVHIVSVCLEFKGKHLEHEAFGYLVPSKEKTHHLGFIFDSCCFPKHDGQYGPMTRITCMIGGAWFQEWFGEINRTQESTFAEVALAAARDYLGIKAQPYKVHVSVMKSAIPQYGVGHLSLVDELEESISHLEMSLIGASYRGVSVNDCILNARRAVEKFAQNRVNST